MDTTQSFIALSRMKAVYEAHWETAPGPRPRRPLRFPIRPALRRRPSRPRRALT